VAFRVDPAVHLPAGVASQVAEHVVPGVELVPQGLALAGVDPGRELRRRHAERHAGEECVGGALADVVVRRGVAALERAARDGVVDLEPADLRARRVDLDLDAAVGHLAQVVRQVHGAAVQIVERGEPRRGHAAPVHLPALGLGEHQRREAGAGCDDTSLLEELTTLHHGTSRSLLFVERAKYTARRATGRPGSSTAWVVPRAPAGSAHWERRLLAGRPHPREPASPSSPPSAPGSPSSCGAAPRPASSSAAAPASSPGAPPTSAGFRRPAFFAASVSRYSIWALTLLSSAAAQRSSAA